MNQSIRIIDLMEQSGVGFGTSGARGLVTAMTDRVCYAYTVGFLQYLKSTGDLDAARQVAIAGDLRSSTNSIMAAVGKAVVDMGLKVVHCGHVPSPAVALLGLARKIPAVMVTGSHIPDDRNGIKYDKVAGEILKSDELGMKEQVVELPDIFHSDGSLKEPFHMPPVEPEAREQYKQRYLDAFGRGALSGLSIGLYEHSSVGRDILYDIYVGLGATVTRLARSDVFLPVDTEAIRDEDVSLAKQWAQEHKFDSIVSTDGDADRPLISDEKGTWLRGDVVGVLAARFLGARQVVTPVSCNTVVEKVGAFEKVHRTRIGSPYVIAKMNEAVDVGEAPVVGYEANGGFLTATAITVAGGKVILPLPTRDAVIAQLAILMDAKQKKIGISKLMEDLPARYTASDRLKEFPVDKSKGRIDALSTGGKTLIESTFPKLGSLQTTDTTDGLRMTFDNGEIVHLRPSGNAPELRCYTEADTAKRAVELNREVISMMETWR